MSRILQILFTRFHSSLYRLSRGRMPGSKNLLVLASQGRKSGKMRRVPLIYVKDGDNYALIASRGGSDHPPVWWLNLQAQPHASVDLRGESIAVTASEATPKLRERLWPAFTAIYLAYDKYVEKTSRRIPIVVLAPRE
ncbi:MAG: nitroreductase/quinone reductase family protein [Chloroflexi bacterium]|nr:nitroreductase/quinone reductase family protein [Chloroflexota bacterium]